MFNNLFKIIVLILLFWLVILAANVNIPQLGSSSDWNYWSGNSSFATTTVATSSLTSILSRDVNRQFAEICNVHASSGVAIIYLTATTTGYGNGTKREWLYGIPLVAMNNTATNLPQACYTIGPDNLYVGQIYAVFFSSTTGQINVTYK